MSRAYLPYLTTLRRIPDPIILSMATREFILTEANFCLCGWAIREAFAVATRTPDAATLCYADALGYGEWTQPHMARRFGGTTDEWRAIFLGVIGSQRDAIEEAFARRVAEAAR